MCTHVHVPHFVSQIVSNVLCFTFRAYIQSVVENLQQDSNMMLADLFDRVRADMERQSVSSPVEFSLTSSPLPICINPEDIRGESC